jgi:hypothetical protein
MLRKKAKEIELRFHPNSAIIGLNITPKENRAPELKKRITNEAAKIYQPKKRLDLGGMFLRAVILSFPLASTS